MQTYLRVWVKLIDWWNCTKVVKITLDLRCVVHVVVFPPYDWVPPVRSCSLCIMISCDTGAYFDYSPFYTVFYLHMIFIRPYVYIPPENCIFNIRNFKACLQSTMYWILINFVEFTWECLLKKPLFSINRIVFCK